MLSLVWSILLFLPILKAQKTCSKHGKPCMTKNFENVSVGNQALRPSNLISSHNIHRRGECLFLCLKRDNCFGFNFRERRRSIYTVNCQLSNSSVRMNMTRMKNGPWVYYEDILVTQANVKRVDQLNPMSCSALLIKHPSTPSGMYYINPEGFSLSPLVQIYCDMTSRNGVGVTVIGHDSESRILVDGYELPGSYRKKIKYNIPMEQIAAIVKQSKKCEQFIKYECYDSGFWFSTPNTSYSWWVSRQGLQMNYWGGAAVDSKKCACGMNNSCAGQKNCNCDKNDLTWREDSGYLADKNTLPVTELRFGDTGHTREKGYHTLGKLLCWG